jgi:hypothetical protein
MIDDICEAVGGMRIGRGNRRTRKKTAPVLLRPPEILHVLNWARTRAAAVGCRRLTAWAMVRPFYWLTRNQNVQGALQLDMFKVKFSELYFERGQKAISGKTGSKVFIHNTGKSSLERFTFGFLFPTFLCMLNIDINFCLSLPKHFGYFFSLYWSHKVDLHIMVYADKCKDPWGRFKNFETIKDLLRKANSSTVRHCHLLHSFSP